MRINAVVVINSLMAQYPNSETFDSCMMIFVSRFQNRLITLMCDNNVNIALSALELVSYLVGNGLLSAEPTTAGGEDGVLMNALAHLLAHLPTLKHRQKFDKNLHKLFYLIVVNYTMRRNTDLVVSDQNCLRSIQGFSIETHKDAILENIAVFCAAVAVQGNSKFRTGLQ